uniref:Uncharacterized protein n=1 Tax=Trichuris muris TaxID=70415 RepID=A0A5S6QLM0_TRIMR
MAPKVTITSSGLDSTRRSSVPAPKPPPYHIDVVFQLLVVGEEKWEETCTKMREHIGKLSEQEKGFIDISSKQITGFALQSEQGAIRAAKVVRFLQDEIPTVFNFACLKRCIGYFLPRPRTDFHYSRLTKDQMLNFGVFLVWLYHHFEQTTFRDGIRGCLYTLLDYMAVDRSEMGVTRFRYVLSLCGGAAQGREPPMSHNHGPQGHKEGELQNEQKGAAEEQPKAEPSAQQSEMPGLQAEVGGQEEVADIPRFREIRRGGRRRPYNRGRGYRQRGVYWNRRLESGPSCV